MAKQLDVIGWREWVSLPDLGIEWTKAKVDTGARSSSLHAAAFFYFTADDGSPWVRFTVHPWQRSKEGARIASAPLLEHRSVRSSSGVSDTRPVIRTIATLGEITAEIDLTLTARDTMGFRMLLGREAVRGRCLVNPGQSFLTGKPPATVTAANRAKRT